jgi:hypothetical protein
LARDGNALTLLVRTREGHMPHSQGKVETFNFRVEPGLKAEFVAAAAADDRPAGQVLRDFMRRYVAARRRRDFVAEASRQSRLVAAGGNDDIDRWIDDVSDTEGWR